MKKIEFFWILAIFQILILFFWIFFWFSGYFRIFLFFILFFLNFFLDFFWIFWDCFQSFRVLLKVTEGTTEHQKWPKISQNRYQLSWTSRHYLFLPNQFLLDIRHYLFLAVQSLINVRYYVFSPSSFLRCQTVIAKAAMAAATAAAAMIPTTAATTAAAATVTSRGRWRTTSSPQTSSVITVGERLQLHQGNLVGECIPNIGL